MYTGLATDSIDPCAVIRFETTPKAASAACEQSQSAMNAASRFYISQHPRPNKFVTGVCRSLTQTSNIFSNRGNFLIT